MSKYLRPIVATDARRLTLDELQSLLLYVEGAMLSWWDDVDAQGMLDCYHAAGDWDGIAEWLSVRNPDRERAVKRYRAILVQCRRRLAIAGGGRMRRWPENSGANVGGLTGLESRGPSGSLRKSRALAGSDGQRDAPRWTGPPGRFSA